MDPENECRVTSSDQLHAAVTQLGGYPVRVDPISSGQNVGGVARDDLTALRYFHSCLIASVPPGAIITKP